MIISYQWLLEYLPQPVPVEELSRILTSIGLEVEAVEKAETVKGGLEGLVIGKVLTCAPHPNADKLKVTTVTTGGEAILNIVCGAPNVAAGQKVVVAPVGTTVHPLNGEAFQIKKAKIRGEASEGMICAEDEVGLGESHAGIMVLPEDALVGALAKDYFKIGAADYAIYIGLTPNRSDAASHIGVARDVCTYLGHHSGEKAEVKLPDYLEYTQLLGDGDSPISVRIDATDGCREYLGVNLSGITVGSSPEWLRTRLATIGVRSINNVVDVTNYVLHEWGQPLHAFDSDKIKGSSIIVRNGIDGEMFTTLDGKERKMRSSDLMICDSIGPLALAGVFGGLESGVTDVTKNVFIESAFFNPAAIRRTSLYYGLRTEAAAHFEKGVDIRGLLPAALRAAQMILNLAGGKMIGDAVVAKGYDSTSAPIDITYEFIKKLSGKQYQNSVITDILENLGFDILYEDKTSLRLAVPSFKHDVRQPADVVEEIMRIDGLDNIPIPQRLNISLLPEIPSDRKLRNKIADSLSGMGFSEIVTNSITNSKYYGDAVPLVRMLNSLSSELDVMRPSLLESGLEAVSYNLARRNMDLLLFEHGFTYNADYSQQPKLALFATGIAQQASVKSSAIKADGYFLKSVVQNLLKASGIKNVALSYEESAVLWKWKNKALCSISEVPAKKRQTFDIKERVWYAEIDWALWTEAMGSVKIDYTEVPRFPAVQRDLALVLDKSVTYAQVQKATDKLKLQPLQSYGLFDVFESDKLGADKKSLALSFTFQLTDRTLTDAETEVLMGQLTSAYTKELGAQIRG